MTRIWHNRVFSTRTLLAVVCCALLTQVAMGDEGRPERVSERDAADREPVKSKLTVAETATKMALTEVEGVDGISIFAARMVASELGETLSGEGPFTLFIPTDKAFGKLPGGVMETLKQQGNEERLAKLLNYHVAPGFLKSDKLVKLSTIDLLNESKIEVQRSKDGLLLAGAKVTTPDIICSNGVIHLVDSVVLSDEAKLEFGIAWEQKEVNLQDLAEVEEFLKGRDVVLDKEGLGDYLRKVTASDTDWTEAKELIEKLSAGNFAERTLAERSLTKMPAVPVELLEEAARSEDPGLAENAKRILKSALSQQKETIAQSLTAIELLEIPGLAEEVYATASKFPKEGQIFQMAKVAMSKTVTAADIPVFTARMNPETAAPLRELVVHGLRQLRDPGLVPQFEAWARNGEFSKVTRLEAAFALAALGKRDLLELHRAEAIQFFKRRGYSIPTEGPVKSIYLSEVKVRDEELWRIRCFPELESLSLSKASVTDAGLTQLAENTELRSLSIATTNVTGSGLIHLRRLSKLESLNLGSNIRLEDEDLVHLRYFPGLKKLYLGRTGVTDEGMVHLKDLTNLEELSLSETKVTGVGFVHLRELRSLRYLSLSETSIEGPGLANLSVLPELKRMSFWGANLGDTAMENLGRLRALEFLNLAHTGVDGAGLVHLGNLTELETLNLWGAKVTDEHLEGLPALPELEDLYLGNAQIEGPGLVHLGKHPKLADLNLKGNPLTDAALEPLGKLSTLTRLVLSETKVTDEGIKQLGGLSGLSKLELAATDIDGSGFESLGGLTSLDEVDLTGTDVDDAGLKHLSGLPKLGTVKLDRTKVTDEGVLYLSKVPKLYMLELRDTAVTGLGMKELSDLDLRFLRVSGANISEAGMEELSTLKNLYGLEIKRTKQSKEAISALKDKLPRLFR